MVDGGCDCEGENERGQGVGGSLFPYVSNHRRSEIVVEKMPSHLYFVHVHGNG